MESLSIKWDPSEQVKLPMEEQKNYIPKKRGLHIPQFIQGKAVFIFYTLSGIGLVLFIVLHSLSLRNVSKEVTGISLKIELLQEESKKKLSSLQESTAAVKRNRNLTSSVLEELGELYRENGKIAKDVAQVTGELHNFKVALMESKNAAPSVLEELAELNRENGRIVKDIAQEMEELHNLTAVLMANANLTPVLEELAELKRENSRIAEDVIQLLEEFHNFTGVLCNCPQNWLTFEKNCYFMSSSRKPWLAAKQSCEKEGAQLLIVNSWVEQNFLVKQFASDHVYWIGLSDTGKEGEWHWLDGTPMSISFWGPGEPNNAGQGEDCATLLHNRKWNDAVCSANEYWICKQKC